MLDAEKIRLPQNEAIPAWYRLSVKDGRVLVISIHQKAMEYLRSLEYSKASMVSGFIKKLRLDAFIPPTESSWGFGRWTLWGPDAVLESKAPKNSLWTSCECALPVFRDDADHQKFIRIRATLSVLFQALAIYGFDGDTEWNKPQLVVINGLRVECDLHGGSLSATLTPAMIAYLRAQPGNSELSEVSNAMKQASRHMLGRPKGYDDSHSYKAHCRQPKWINLTVPGDACGLDPGDYHDTSLESGYDMHPHNVDSSFQQLSFLMGLAKLHQLAEKEPP
jgi:hypothetical protein